MSNWSGYGRLLAGLLMVSGMTGHALAQDISSPEMCRIEEIESGDIERFADVSRDADNGSVCAQLNLGYYFYTGQDYPRAETWYQRAAENGERRAQFQLALLYRDGLLDGGEERALPWFELAAEQGDVEAQNETGVIYWQLDEQGKSEGGWEHSNSNREKAGYWLERAANAGSSKAALNLGYFYQVNGIQAFAGDDTYLPDQQLAFAWHCRAALANEPQAVYEVGEAYRLGRGIDADIEQTRLWFLRAEALGEKKSHAWLDNDKSGTWYTQLEKWWKYLFLDPGEATCTPI